MQTGGVLACDVATTTGWAYASPDDVQAWPIVYMPGLPSPAPITGHFSCASGASGYAYCTFVDPFLDVMGIYRPSHVVVEATIFPRGQKKFNPLTNTKLGVLVAFVKYICHRRNASFSKASVLAVRKHFLGHASPEDPKETVMIECRRRGWKPRSLDESDACAILDYHIVTTRYGT